MDTIGAPKITVLTELLLATLIAYCVYVTKNSGM